MTYEDFVKINVLVKTVFTKKLRGRVRIFEDTPIFPTVAPYAPPPETGEKSSESESCKY